MHASPRGNRAFVLAMPPRHARAEATPSPAEPLADTRYGLGSTIAGLGVYGAFLLCLAVLS